jgi:hypothetical protein
VLSDCDGQTRFVWRTDLLPSELADRTAERMARGLAAIKTTLEAAARPVGVT